MPADAAYNGLARNPTQQYNAVHQNMGNHYAHDNEDNRAASRR